MRIGRFARDGDTGTARLGVAHRDMPMVDIVDAWNGRAGHRSGASVPQWLRSTLAMIEAGPDAWAEVAVLAREAATNPALIVDDGAPGFRWLCPMDRLSSLRDFLAFESHVLEGAKRRGSPVPPYWYEAPVYYKGNHRSILGPGDECPWPSYTDKMDFELELAMIVGRGGRDISSDDAGAHIFGFTIMNDLSARDIQAKEMTAWLGPAKGKDFATALGPYIVTADELGTMPDLEMICRVNGTEWGRARSAEAHWSWADMIAHVSMSENIWPGDVYGSGTPGRCCGLDLGRFLEEKDVVELEIEKIGSLAISVGPRPLDP